MIFLYHKFDIRCFNLLMLDTPDLHKKYSDSRCQRFENARQRVVFHLASDLHSQSKFNIDNAFIVLWLYLD